MENLGYIRDLAIILAIAVAMAAVLHRFKFPSIAGFILAGVIVGPHVLAIVGDIREVEILAEVGVALLLFGIGLDLSLDRLRRLWWPILAGGTLQVGLTVLIAMAVAQMLGFPWRTSLFIGLLVSVSSTAIVLRGLEGRGEIDAPHGRFTLGILVFQDLCVVPMMLAIPLLSGGSASPSAVFSALLRAVAVIAGVLMAARLVIPHIFRIIARTRQRHLFVTTVLLVCIGTAWAIAGAGVSLALGAFLAGLVVAGGEYRHQALADLIPFKDVFTGIFFVSIGMLLVPADIGANSGPILLVLAGILIGKAVIVFAAATLMRLPLRASVLTAVALAQVGEFSFVMARAADGTDLLSLQAEGNIFAATVLSMFITPFALSFGPRLAASVGKLRFLSRLESIAVSGEVSRETDALRDHVIIGGYGFAGRKLAGALKSCGIPYIIADLNVETVHKARLDGVRIHFGDVTNPDVLEWLGAREARELVLVINDPGAVERAVRTARALAPHLHITARTNYLLDVESLQESGADQVVASELESAGKVVEKVLERCRVDRSAIDSHMSDIARESSEDS